MRTSEEFDDLVDLFSDLDSTLSNAIEERLRISDVLQRQRLPLVTIDADNDQRAFIDSESFVVRLIAPAGSGKTQSVANRVLRCLAEGYDPRSFLLLTFDNAAAASLRVRRNSSPSPVLRSGLRGL